jgi:hypothetical protein
VNPKALRVVVVIALVAWSAFWLITRRGQTIHGVVNGLFSDAKGCPANVVVGIYQRTGDGPNDVASGTFPFRDYASDSKRDSCAGEATFSELKLNNRENFGVFMEDPRTGERVYCGTYQYARTGDQRDEPVECIALAAGP